MLRLIILAIMIYFIVLKPTNPPSNDEYRKYRRYRRSRRYKRPYKTIQNKEEYNPDWYFDPETGLWTNRKNQDKTTHQQQENATTQQAAPDYSKSYQPKHLLTKNEWYEYRKLRDFAETKGLRVCPKVRLLDLVEPRRGEGYMSLLGKIQSKHVDFVIADRDMHVKAILELDDNSHDRPDRQERDNFVNEVLTSVGYKVIRTRGVTEETLKDIS